MRKQIAVMVASTTLFTLASSFTVATSPQSRAANPKPVTLELLWSEEFNAKKAGPPNSKYWGFDLGDGYGWGNSEKEYYTSRASNVVVNGKGQLVITATRIADQSQMAVGKDPLAEKILTTCPDCQFTSAKLKTAKKLSFMYGRMEARIKTPSGMGVWPAFWMLGSDLLQGNPWPECGEIDILEQKGYMPEAAFGTLHGPNFQGGGAGSVFNYGSPLTAGYHTYAIEWIKNKIDFYVDENLYYTATPKSVEPGRWVFNHPFFLILNLAMGGEFTGDIDPSLNEAKMSVDYIRYYSINGAGKVTKG